MEQIAIFSVGGMVTGARNGRQNRGGVSLRDFVSNTANGDDVRKYRYYVLHEITRKF